MKRHIEVLIGEDGTARWDEGTLEVPDRFKASLAGFPPGASVELAGDYQRVDAKTRVLKLTEAPKLVATAADKAERSRSQPDEFARWVGYLNDASARSRALVGLEAAQRNDHGAALEQLRLALAAPRSSKAENLVIELWASLPARGHPPLERQEGDRLLEYAWDRYDRRPHEALLGPGITEVYRALPDEHGVEPPWHFGGPRATPGPAFRPWISRRLIDLAGKHERPEVERLLKLSDEELRAYSQEVEAYDEAVREEAYAEMISRLPGDSDDSPPDDAPVDEELLRGSTYAAIVAEFENSVRGGSPQPRRWMGELVKRRSGAAARDFAFAYDAAMLLSQLAPELVPRLRAVAAWHGAPRGGWALCQLEGDDAWVLLHAPDGALGEWLVHTGDAATVLSCVPSEGFPGAAEAVRLRKGK